MRDPLGLVQFFPTLSLCYKLFIMPSASLRCVSECMNAHRPPVLNVRLKDYFSLQILSESAILGSPE